MIEGYKFNTAQRILLACGVDKILLFAHHKERKDGLSESNTKKGPGRVHIQGKRKDEGKS